MTYARSLPAAPNASGPSSAPKTGPRMDVEPCLAPISTARPTAIRPAPARTGRQAVGSDPRGYAEAVECVTRSGDDLPIVGYGPAGGSPRMAGGVSSRPSPSLFEFVLAGRGVVSLSVAGPVLEEC